jgi:hypothetical protein
MESRRNTGLIHYRRDPAQIPLPIDLPTVNLECVKCAKSFASGADLTQHYKSVHKVLAPLQVRLTA